MSEGGLEGNNEERRCSVCGCLESETSHFVKNSKHGKNLCNKHYLQLQKFGKITDNKSSDKVINRKNEPEHLCSICGKSSLEDDRFVYSSKYGRDLCLNCHGKFVKYGEIKIFSNPSDTEHFCSVCEKSSFEDPNFYYNSKYGKNLCCQHYGQLRKYGKITNENYNPKINHEKEYFCEICGEPSCATNSKFIYNSKFGKVLCNKHYSQLCKYGKTFRTKYDSNEIVIYDSYAELILYDAKNNEKAKGIIDIEDVEKVKKYKWNVDKYGYIKTHNTIKLHEYLLGKKDGFLVDHIDGNPLNCHKKNLRHATHQENNMNKRNLSTNTSGHAGVSYHKKANKWRSYINFDEKQIHLGLYDNIDDAIEVRVKGEIKYFGEYRRDEKYR